jgi:hypothetical protein
MMPPESPFRPGTQFLNSSSGRSGRARHGVDRMRALFCALKSGERPVKAWVSGGYFVAHAAKNHVLDSARGGFFELLISGS